ncbi:MAG: replication-associated recombination protein A [Planctomycetes bacterium]|nr:replication-associated recombination protein A [Planctomycetota bacterium]
MRPRTLAEFHGQGDAVGRGRALREAIERGEAGSLLLWGPPGCGKTTLALLIAEVSGLHFEPFSAVLSGVKDVREAVARADAIRATDGRGTLLFIDEIHRFNRAQQDAFLPFVESGRIVLVGATTENPSFSINRALLSRCRVVALQPLDDAAIGEIVDRALGDEERGLGRQRLTLDAAARERLVLHANGDARRALTALEAAARIAALRADATIDLDALAEAAQHRALAHDRDGDHHFDLLSALHKSLRNSDVQASIYWLARFLEAGADPLQAARRMVAMAAEDIGLADPMALQVATAALLALQNLGLPEGRLPLAEAAIYLATAPKSRGACTAIDAALTEVRSGRQRPVPAHLRNAPTALSRSLGHGRDYRFAPAEPGHVADMHCLPEGLEGAVFYEPGDWGFEAARMRERLDEIARRRARRE